MWAFLVEDSSRITWLGLVGTIMGLTLTLTGMGTAFYTTLLVAVLGGVILRVFAKITEQGTEGTL